MNDSTPPTETAGSLPTVTPAIARRTATAFRAASHLGVWACVLVPTLVELARGWRPLGDDAAIASRAYQVFTLHPPLTGLASAASNQTGHEVYGLGPLLFFLLAVPVRIDPAHGLLWGAALWCGLVLSLAIEAAWSRGKWLAGALVAVAVLDLLWLTPEVFENLAWNAYFPIPFLVASMVFAWLVATGSPRWWPVLVVSASVAAQCHLFFAISAAALVATAFVLGLPNRARRWGWILVGLGLGLLCWLAPLVQQFEGPEGNFSTVLHAGHGQSTLGASYALHDLAMAGALHPIWLTRLPSSFWPLVAIQTTYPAFYGALILGLLGAVALGAWATGRPGLGALSALTLTLAGGLVVSLVVFPDKNFLSLAYLLDAFWVVAILLWLVLGWTLFKLGQAAVARWGGRARPPFLSAVRAMAPWGLLGGLVALVTLGGIDVQAAGANPKMSLYSTAEVRLAAQATATIERSVPPGSVSVVVLGSDTFTQIAVTEGIAYQLEYQGWIPGMTGSLWVDYTGLRAPPPSAPTFFVRLSGSRVLAVDRST